MTNERKKYLKQKRKEKILVFIVQVGILVLFLVIWELLANKNIIKEKKKGKNTSIYSSNRNINNIFRNLGTTSKQ